ncbi:MAG: cytochrome c [Candidatus Thiodiazotropha sp. (ex Ctena orbiculata)]|uniref:Cytochrome c n=1 Tax=Candidatus Thiodiazotropha taylori TaxID=2792791 RepID=A0A944M9V3_9GAMM|nr:cytochrome c [Candidatus Thiodiazotropha taylori]MBT2989991.1 cytochrome c [Candidatus Thiodiazotropha taylori]MBT2998286.1 cytochrome c [Candidatus Thiodiazotropha taylori]MBT3002603.1 cytochrome c [Candidatus Thiodiazotropha taylori]MBT3029292.1 cytochrome c [Candidatus Thiodiazotropha taylori]
MNISICRALSLVGLIASFLISTAYAQNSDDDTASLYLAKACAGCHGVDGRSPVKPYYPKVAGQNEAYLYNQLRDLKNGSRSNSQSNIMKGIMTAVSDEEMRAIAAWLAKQ